MTTRPLKNVGASVRARLLARSRETGEDFQFLLWRYAVERFLFRLGRSPHRLRFVLKGAMLFALWNESFHRQTQEPLAKLPGDWGWAQSSALLVNTIALDRRLDILSG